MKSQKIAITICMVCLLAGCSGRRSYIPNDTVDADIQILRFDSALLSLPIDSVEMSEQIGGLYESFPYMMPFFAENVIGVDRCDTAWLCGALSHFLTDTLYGFAATNKYEQEMYADVSWLKKQLGTSFGRLRYLYPDIDIPDIYFIVSGFNASLFFMDDDIVVGADMYLGSDYPYYNRVVYDYQKKTMRPECIATDVMSVYLFRLLPYTYKQSRLLDNMLYRGKVMYLLSVLMPEEDPWEVMGYSKEEWQWCKHNEKAIWRLMLDKQDLYKTETVLLTSYLNDGPFTSEISQDSPSRLGAWVGWQIVEQYMSHNPDVTLQDLMAEDDAQVILEKSHYRP